ncbi:MAG: LAGLIDADG family homing endonuclease [Candidatus Diapherotrites archaeon]
MRTFSQLDSKKQQNFYVEIFDLKKQSLGYKKIIKKFKDEKQVKLSLGTLSYWFNHDVKIIGGENYFVPEASSELSYVLGVMFGDGSLIVNTKRKEYVLKLEAIDRDFVEKFSGCSSKLLKKEKSFAVCYKKPRRGHSATYSVQVRSKKLFNFVKEIKKDFENGKKFIEKFPAKFIQGLADSEGCPSISAATNFNCDVMVACSTNFSLLEFVKYLLKFFGIKSNLYLHKHKGESDSKINGRVITRTIDLFVLYISKDAMVKNFAKNINFSIKRKSEKLEDAVFLLNNYKKSERLSKWKDGYWKVGNKWVKQQTKWFSSID